MVRAMWRDMVTNEPSDVGRGIGVVCVCVFAVVFGPFFLAASAIGSLARRFEGRR